MVPLLIMLMFIRILAVSANFLIPFKGFLSIKVKKETFAGLKIFLYAFDMYIVTF